MLLQCRLVIQQIQVRRGTDHVQVDHMFGLRCKMRARTDGSFRTDGRQITCQQRPQCRRAKSEAAAPEQFAAVEVKEIR